MTEEIKEIFYKLRSDDYYEKHYQQSVYYEKDLNKLENYITNLQKENEKYKKIFEAKERFSKIMPDDTDFVILSKADYDRQQEDIELTAIKLKSRNEKAVEYIKEHTDKLKTTRIPKIDFNYNDLLNILEGGDE